MELLPCGVAAITGGAGFVGMRLAQKLAAAGQSVVLLDLRPPAPGWQNSFSAEVLAKDANVQSCGISGQDSHNASACGFFSQAKVSFRQADLRRLGDLLAGFQGVDTVYHVASFGMSGAESLAQADLIYSINVQGTHNVIQACSACSVERLVYVSTCNVAFDGTPKLGLDETMASYVNPATFHDVYSVTKAWAEQMVLQADCSPWHPLASPGPQTSHPSPTPHAKLAHGHASCEPHPHASSTVHEGRHEGSKGLTSSSSRARGQLQRECLAAAAPAGAPASPPLDLPTKIKIPTLDPDLGHAVASSDPPTWLLCEPVHGHASLHATSAVLSHLTPPLGNSKSLGPKCDSRRLECDLTVSSSEGAENLPECEEPSVCDSGSDADALPGSPGCRQVSSRSPSTRVSSSSSRGSQGASPALTPLPSSSLSLSSSSSSSSSSGSGRSGLSGEGEGEALVATPGAPGHGLNSSQSLSLSSSGGSQGGHACMAGCPTPASSPPAGPGCGVLRCCAVRPPGIYGPGEQRHLPRILHHVKQGLLLFTFGDGQADWVHVDNLVDCMLLAAEGLRAERGCVAGGQAYFVSDGAPVKHFDFLGPILQQLGYKMPKTRIHWRVMQAFAAINEFVHALLGPLLQVPLPLCMAEVVKVAIPHYFSIEKAYKELGFVPKSFTARSVADWYSEHGYACGRLTSEERTREAQSAAHDMPPTGDSRRGLRPTTRTASARSRLQSFLRRRKAAAPGLSQDGAARVAPVVLSPSLPPTPSPACVIDAVKSEDSKAVGRGVTVRGRGALTSSSFGQLLTGSLSRSFPPTLHLASQQQPGL